MRISDWSSDVCSSDLIDGDAQPTHEVRRNGGNQGLQWCSQVIDRPSGRGDEKSHVEKGEPVPPHHARAEPSIKERTHSPEQRPGFNQQEIIGSPKNIKGQHGKEERRSEEHTSELQSLMRISYAVFC